MFGHTTYFHAAAAGRGTLSVGVRAAGQDVKHSIRDLGGGLYKVLFYPRAPIPHKVDVRYNGIPVQGEIAVYLFLVSCPNWGAPVSCANWDALLSFQIEILFSLYQTHRHFLCLLSEVRYSCCNLFSLVAYPRWDSVVQDEVWNILIIVSSSLFNSRCLCLSSLFQGERFY